MKIRVLIIAVSLFMSVNCFCQNQGISNIWVTGYASSIGFPFGNTTIDFYNGFPTIVLDSNPMNLAQAHSNICASNGKLLFYTNGVYIADSTKNTMLNGNGLNPSSYTTNNQQSGLFIAQANLIIPVPNSIDSFYLFHSTIDNPPYNNKSHYLYYSIIDMSLNGGKGGVVAKNTVVISDTLNPGKITACKHGNGRDWWITCLRANSNIIYKLLVTPYGIQGPFTQSIGTARTISKGQVRFSKDGTKFAHFHSEHATNSSLEIFDFDRCTGIFNNANQIILPQAIAWGGGVEFSANGNLLYTSSIDSVYQFDLQSGNIAASKIVIAAWDSFYDPNPPFATFFENMELAPDGKIYITTGNGTTYMHVINNPNNLGSACNLVQHGVQLPAIDFNTLPNHPNYFLGRDIGSPCDTITVWMGEQSPPTPKAGVKVFPNPNDGKFTLWFSAHDKLGWVEVYDVNGNLVFKEGVAQWSQYKQVDIRNKSDGIYFVKIVWAAEEMSCKVIKD